MFDRNHNSARRSWKALKAATALLALALVVSAAASPLGSNTTAASLLTVAGEKIASLRTLVSAMRLFRAASEPATRPAGLLLEDTQRCSIEEPSAEPRKRQS